MTGSQTDYRTLLKRSLAAIDQLEKKLAAAQQRLMAAEQQQTEPIAVLGFGCRFPGGVETPEAYWALLRDGIDAVTEVPADRWDVDAVFDPDPDAPGRTYTRWGGFLTQVDRFDAPFFGISPREAISLDPQQRLLLEVSWEALERAAIAPSSIAGTRTGVYVGISSSDYVTLFTEEVGFQNGGAYTASGASHSIAAGRISYFFGLHGPSVALDTACSSSLVAMHDAIQSLRRREISLALAGGVNLVLSASGSILTSRARMMSFDGRCKTFDASADGYVRAEGCGMLVLKRLSDAQRDKDPIVAVIRGSALNQDGRSSGLTAPNGAAQEMVIREALADAGLTPADISVIEAHGTGTSLGDPIEVNALGRVFGQGERSQPLVITSGKTNIGHSEGAAGIAGVIKAILELQHREVPPHLHLRTPNPLISWDSRLIRIPRTLEKWESPDGRPRRIGVSSFGFSGTNGHLVLEEAPVVAPPGGGPRPRVLVLSAQTAPALRDQAQRFRTYLADPGASSWRDITFTAGHGRSHLPERLALVADGTTAASGKLEAFLDDRPAAVARGRAASSAPEIAFLFTGQGAQFFGMARELYASHPIFRDALDACAAVADPLLERSLVDVIMNDESARALLDDTAFTQPALFAVEHALAQLWHSWGVDPTVVMGHSVGEYVAACLAGVFSMPDALTLIAHRGRLMSRLPRIGSMAAVFADESTVSRAVAGFEAEVSLGAINGPENIVISGRTSGVDAILSKLAAAGIDARRLNVSHAFHSPLMDVMLDEFERIAETMTFAPPRIGIVSNVTGRMAGNEIATPGYWRQHVRAAVRFSDGIATLHSERIRTFLEIGPSPLLTKMAQRCPDADNSVWLTSLRTDAKDTDAMLGTLAELYVSGQPIDWAALAGEDAWPVELPTYAFQRERYWHDLSRSTSRRPSGVDSGHALLGDRLPSPLHVYQAAISLTAMPWLADHRIRGYTLFPATGFLELALAAAQRALDSDDVVLENISLENSLDLPDDGTTAVQVIVFDEDTGAPHISVYSAPANPPAGEADRWRLHATASAAKAEMTETPPVVLERGEELDLEKHYADLANVDAVYGPAFRGLRQMWRSGNTIVGRLELPSVPGVSAERMLLHPALLDACLHTAGVGLPWDNGAVPVGIDRYRVHRAGGTSLWSQVTIPPTSADDTGLRVDMTVSDDEGRLVAEIHGLEFHRAPKASFERRPDPASRPAWLLEVDWEIAPPPAQTSSDRAPRWLILSSGGPLAFDLATQLDERGGTVSVVSRADSFGHSEHGWQLDTLDPVHYRRLFDEAARSGIAPWTDIVWLAGERDVSRTELDAMQAAHREQISALLAALPAFAEAGAAFWLVTGGSQPVAGSIPSLSEAPIWGLGGVIASEYPSLRAVRVDLDPVERDDDAAVLAAVLGARDGNDRVAIRGGQRYVARMTQGVLERPDAVVRRLEIDERGVLENLQWRAVPRTAPGPGSVEIRVLATGLNFRDVLNALGMYPGDPGPLGNECAGVISAVGAEVDAFAVGDEVVAMIDQSFATFVVAPAVMTVHKPSNLTFAEAATIPVTFLTAEYGLSQLGRMAAGDRVLVHAATGGVGMAALQLARRAGAEIFATAGSPAKRALARSLGAHHISDSRSLAFVDDFSRETNGEGVDIVINSLAGDFIPASLGLLRKGGRFVEIGKTGIWDRATVAASYPSIEYYPLYLGEVAASEPAVIRDMLRRLMDDFAGGVLKPLPQTIYPIERAEEAFRFMGQGRHTGKIVLTQRQAPPFRPDATYLVTGGFGGLGLVCARGLVDRGARHIVLTGRRGPTPEAQSAIDAMESAGASVTIALGDVGVETEVVAILDSVRDTQPALRGIIHAAGIVDDALLVEQDWTRFERVMRPKVAGAWHLHTCTRDLPLDFFVMFSSGATLLGSPGQGNYAAANAFMNALASVREAEGRAALSIEWGGWSDIGMTADVDEHHRRRWAEQGLKMIPPRDGVRMLFDTLAGSRKPVVAVLPIDRSKLSPLLGAFFERLLTPASAGQKRETSVADLRPRIVGASAEERLALVTSFLTDQLSKVLAIDRATLFRTDQSVMELGLDSLMAMELRNRVQSAVKVRLSVAELLSGFTIDDLVARVLDGMDLELLPAVGANAAASWEEGSL